MTIGGATVVNIPGGNTRGTQRPDLVPGVDPYLKDGVRWLNPAAFAAPLPGTFGNLPRNFLRGPGFWQVDLMASKEFRFAQTQGLQIRVEVFNITNHLNYENPAAVLPAGTIGQPFTDAVAARSATCSARSTGRSGSAPRARRRSRCGTCSSQDLRQAAGRHASRGLRNLQLTRRILHGETPPAVCSPHP